MAARFPISKALWQLLAQDRRRSAFALFGLTLIGTALETLGVGIVAPTIQVLTTSEKTQSTAILAALSGALGLRTPQQMVVACMVTLVAVYAVKALYLAFLASRQAAFSFDIQISISDRLFLGYLRQPWTFHLERNSAQLLRNLTTEVGNLNNVTQSFMSVGTEGFVLLGVTGLLVIAEPLGASLVIVTLGLAAWSFHHLTKSRLHRWGQARQYHDGLRLLHLQQGINAVKDIKLLGLEDDFFARYRVHNEGSRRVGQRQVTLQQLPRLWIELLAVTGMASLVLIMLGQGRPLAALLPTLGLFAAAAFRLMPSVIRVMNCVQIIRYYFPVVGLLHGELALVESASAASRSSALPFREGLTLSGVSFRYPSAGSFALQNVTLSIPRGTSVGFVGGSGAGKSTIVDVILGLLSPASGTVEVDGVDIHANLRGWQDQIGYVPQSIFLTDDTLRRNIAFGLPEDQIDDATVRGAVRAARLEEFVESLPKGLETTVG